MNFIKAPIKTALVLPHPVGALTNPLLPWFIQLQVSPWKGNAFHPFWFNQS
jgi:hypothetical protein